MVRTCDNKCFVYRMLVQEELSIDVTPCDCIARLANLPPLATKPVGRLVESVPSDIFVASLSDNSAGVETPEHVM